MTTPRRARIGSVAKVTSGHPFRSDQWTPDGVPAVKIANVKNGYIDLDTAPAFVSMEDSQAIGRFLLQQGDIVISMTGDVGRVARIITDSPLVLNQRVGLFTVDSTKADPLFFFYTLRTTPVRQEIVRTAFGSAQANTSPSLIEQVQIPLPPLETQRAIAEVLGALDDKIAANRRTIDTADTLRAAIWGKATRDAHHVLLSSLAAFINGGAFTKGASGNGRPVVRIVEMNQGVSDTTVRTDLEVKDDQVVRAGDFLMSWSGSLTTSRWFGEESILNQHIFKVIPAEGVPLWAVASAVETKMPYFQFVASNKATTMGHIQRHHLDEDVAWPTVTSALNLQGTALWDLALAAERENQILASTRDELLPLLMSGRITVRAASSRVEEVV
ncbi:restriction endonuclease subunit S [Schaalia sp. JY-X169]|uniref:restriction endonuclease subunit S n=1 Tax=Schaalia sp. JY-X169 TaxID=2758572 RepID=UPI0015F53457|nr:restriction endonuclease subunit S [Schaalia sp. JY-X169]